MESSTPKDIHILLKEKIDDVTAQQEVTDLCDQWRRVSGADITAEHIFHLTPEIQDATTFLRCYKQLLMT